VRPEALVPISPLLKDILLADPDTAAAYPDRAPRVLTVSTAALATAEIEPAAARTPTALPLGRPDMITPDPDDFRDGAVCMSYAPGGFVPAIRVGGRLASGSGLLTSRYSEDGVRLADRVQLAPGSAALVRAMSSPEAASGSLHLVTDQGIRYGLAGAAVATMLGYDPGQAVPLPASLLDRLPAGPALDPIAARRPVTAP
jgi:hypothetical protein